MNHIVVSYAGADRQAASLVIGKLKKLGHTVTPVPASARNFRAARQVKTGGDLLVLWSRSYANAVRKPAPALATLRLDTAAPPPKAKTIDLRQWRGRDNHRGWRAVLATLTPAPIAAAIAPTPVVTPALEQPMKETLNTKEYTGPQFIHLAVMVALLAGAGAWMWQFLPH